MRLGRLYFIIIDIGSSVTLLKCFMWKCLIFARFLRDFTRWACYTRLKVFWVFISTCFYQREFSKMAYLWMVLSKRVFKNGIPLDGGYFWMVDTSGGWVSLIGFEMSFPQWYLNKIYGPYNISLLKFLLFSLIIIAMTFYLA